jgi:hypothetical protein
MFLPLPALGQSGTRSAEIDVAVRVVLNGIQAASNELSQLDNRAPKLSSEVQQLMDQLAALQAPTQPMIEPAKESAPLQVEFKPPLAYESKKSDAVRFVLENGRISLLDLELINSAIQANLPAVMAAFRADTKQVWDEVWPVASGDFDVRIEGKSTEIATGRRRLSWSYRVVRKPERQGEMLAQFQASGSLCGQAMRNADPKKVVARFHVYPDSHELFRELRKMAWDRGFEVSWVPRESGESIFLGSGGGGGIRVGG